MNVNIRLATIEDVPGLQALIRDSVSTLSAEYYTPTQIASSLSHIFGVDTQLILAARNEGFRNVELAATLPGVPFYLAHGYQKAEEILIQMKDGESLSTFRMTKSL